MKYTALLILTLGLSFFGCNSDTKPDVSAKTVTEARKLSDGHNDKDEIRTLIRQMLEWADSQKNDIDLLPALDKDSICIGFDFDKQKLNVEKLRKTGFFANEFIDNFNQIIQTLDKKIKNNELEKWNVYELPTFSFANDASPWCSCQDNFPWEKVEIEVASLSNDKGALKWNWGKPDSKTDLRREDFAIKFRVVKEDGKWKISYLQGFDYEESIKIMA